MDARVARTIVRTHACIMEAGPVLVCWCDTFATVQAGLDMGLHSVRKRPDREHEPMAREGTRRATVGEVQRMATTKAATSAKSEAAKPAATRHDGCEVDRREDDGREGRCREHRGEDEGRRRPRRSGTKAAPKGTATPGDQDAAAPRRRSPRRSRAARRRPAPRGDDDGRGRARGARRGRGARSST